MFGINEKSKLNKTIFKKAFYEKSTLSNADKDLFSSKIAKITWLYSINQQTTNIKPYKDELREYLEIEIIEVYIAAECKLERIAEVIMRSIPYPIVLVFRYQDQLKLYLAQQKINAKNPEKNILEELIYTDWLSADSELFSALDIRKLNMSNMYALYSDMLDQISIYKAKQLGVSIQDNISGEQARAITAKIAELDAQIAKLRTRLRSETQFNRTIELNMEIKKLEKVRNEICI